MVFPILVDTYVPAFLHVLAWRGDVRYKRVLPTIIHTKYLGGFRVDYHKSRSTFIIKVKRFYEKSKAFLSKK